MKPSRFTLLLLGAVLSAPTLAADAAADVEAGLLAITALGKVNGQALACAQLPAAARAKSLMLAHAPKTQRFGDAYEEATQAAYLAQTRAKDACPEPLRLIDQLNRLALQLAATLPVAVQQPK
jgi:hypothetical protein